MYIIVCDDNPEFAEMFSECINNFITSSKLCSNALTIDIITDSKAVIPFLKTHEVDVMFLDISMPDIDGFEIAQYIFDYQYKTYLIFVSNLEDRVFSSFKYRPFRFIRKSNYTEEIKETLNSLFRDISLKSKFITINKYKEVIPVNISSIIYVEKEPHTNYIIIYCMENSYRYRSSIAELEELFSDFEFVKSSSSALINLDHIIRIKDNTVFLDGGYKFQITSSKYKKEIVQKFMNYMRDK